MVAAAAETCPFPRSLLRFPSRLVFVHLRRGGRRERSALRVRMEEIGAFRVPDQAVQWPYERCRGGRNWAQVVVLCNFLEDIVQVRQ